MNLLKSLWTPLLMLAAWSNASATMILLEDGRYVSQRFPGSCQSYDEYYNCDSYSPSRNVVKTPTTPFADFNERLFGYESGEGQVSQISEDAMSGSGYVYVGPDGAYSYSSWGESVFSVTFTADFDTSFNLSGYLDTHYGVENSMTLREDGSTLFFATTDDDLSSFDYSGIFSEGHIYTLELIADANGLDTNYESYGWEFDLQTTATVPLPASVFFLASGLMLLGMNKLRRAD